MIPPESKRRTALGRGLSALLTETFAPAPRGLQEIPLDRLIVPEHQPRTYFDPRSLDELKESIARHGLLQPLVVRDLGNGTYELIAGERRLRALKMLGWEKAPAVVQGQDAERIELALIENIQRENLNPLEEARAFLHLMDARKLTQEELAERLQKSRPYVANKVRLLHLPEEIQQLLFEGKLSEGHARALLSLGSREEMLAMAERIVALNLNVRSVEEAVRARKGRRTRKKEELSPQDPLVRLLEDALGTPVVVRRTKKGGEIRILFHSEEQLEEIVRKLKGNSED